MIDWMVNAEYELAAARYTLVQSQSKFDDCLLLITC